jgi:hypothetical protein
MNDRPLLAALLAVALVTPAAAHQERRVESPARPGPEPEAFVARVNPSRLVVCKPTSRPTTAERAAVEARLAQGDPDAPAELAAWERNTALFPECCFEHVQDAVNAAGDDTDILIMPGLYREEPYRVCPESAEGDNPDGSYSYEYHAANPNDANLIAMIGKRRLTLEGTGARPTDVVVDVGFAKDVGIRCDRCEQVVYRNFWLRDAEEHGVYTIDTDGYVYDRMVGSYSRAYQLFAFASDHGLFQDSEAYGGSDSGFYIGAAANTPGRFSAKLLRSRMHTNAIGYSGTNGNYVLLQDNEITGNCLGFTSDSEPTAHANFPQSHAQWVDNHIHHNNFDVYAPGSPVPPGGPGYGFLHYPCGSGALVVGVNDNRFEGNRVYGHDRYGALLIANGAVLEGFNGSNNVFRGNVVGLNAMGDAEPNLLADFWWDEWGTNNCWEDNGAATGDPMTLPTCALPNVGVGNPLKSALLASCLIVDSETGQTAGACPWGTSNQAPYQNRDQAECGNSVIDAGEDCDPGYAPWPADLAGESCQSLGHGDGTLACKADCTWDFAGCAIGGPACGQATVCGGYAMERLRIARGGAPAGNESALLHATGVDGTGRAFDPRTEGLALAVRDQSGAVHTAVVPAGSPLWRARPAAAPTRLVFRDPAGTHGGVTRIVLRAAGAGFAGLFDAQVRIRRADLTAAGDAVAATAVLRIGDDCWEEAAPCRVSAGGRTARCATVPRTVACPAP